MTAVAPAPSAVIPPTRVRVFLDYWNFQLSLNERESLAHGVPSHRFKVDWKKVGPWMAAKACEVASIRSHSFDGIIIYTSYNPATPEGAKFKNWVNTWLDRQPGVNVQLRERKPRGMLNCPACHRPLTHCHRSDCGKAITSTVEKGVDTLLATDMIRLAWEGAYDLAVLATLDSDLVPAVEFLNARGLKVIQAGFPPKGIDLATSCWGSFDVFPLRGQISRP